MLVLRTIQLNKTMARKLRKGKSVSSKTVRNHIQLEKARSDRLRKVTFDEALAIIDYDDNDTETRVQMIMRRITLRVYAQMKRSFPLKDPKLWILVVLYGSCNQGCVVCGDKLSIRNVQNEHIKGLASVWHILCEKCEAITNVLLLN